MTGSSFIINSNTRLILNGSATLPIIHAVNILKRDMERTLAYSNAYYSDKIVINYLSDEKARNKETFSITFTDEEGEHALNITAYDDLGIIYGILYVSHTYLGVEPFWFFNDKEPETKEYIEIERVDYVSSPNKVRYRGWFVNDEVLINGWKTGSESTQVWEIIYETLLRCGGNMIIPGTDKKALENRRAASEWGLYITHHHAEPLGAEMFLRVYPDKEASYAVHSDLFKKIWEKGVISQKDKKVVWNIGFRGQGDAAFWKNDSRYKTDKERGRLISQIMRIQMGIVRKHVKNPAFCTNIYGEIMGLYNKGYIDVPDGVIKIWADNGFGKMVSRRQENDNPRVYALPTSKDKEGNGIYYHMSFHDLQTSNHLTMLPNSPEFVAAEIEKAFDAGADDYMIVNCGNIKPHTYTLGVISTLWKSGTIDVAGYRADYVRKYYLSEQDQIQKCYMDYFKSPIQYGEHEDDKAGEEFYNYLTREIICHLVRGAEKEETLESLLWATGELSFKNQVKWFKEKCEEGVGLWGKYRKEVQSVYDSINDAKDRQLFFDNIVLQSIIHDSGCRGAVKVCAAYEEYLKKNYFEAYMLAQDGMKIFEEALAAMKNAEHDQWNHFYWNDCLVNVSLTVYTIDSLRKYLRILGDGPVFNEWEKQELFSANDRQIGLQTAYFNQLSDDELYGKIRQTQSQFRKGRPIENV
ncbi:glycosyl hydrolase 115 family protein [Sporolactobacillus shoreicorticis]|uniref:Glycosyl hydrolase 115 family protein n=1 Tax=Sporolactobacillus shoreicorticis TaxID=1923877 RepID=A0ABW5SAL6_9BACL|nr:glycosyl hydrolase 115 family protein [Sporolactobacillus shoreicorticis]MCO7127888.1 glycosyl hydrolase 115 family protein [Sporolactobacillus shoreicorticis]